MQYNSTKPFDVVARSNVNAVWGALTIEVLARLGVECVVTSPGSRSTPLVVAAARNPKIETLSILDERSASFFALGHAKQTHRPVALICTSGSAPANYLPAVVEASMSGTPLLLLSADRPPELRDCSSGQTIDQLKLFGNYVRGFREMALPDVREGMLDYLRQSLVHAVNLSLGPDAGPVHLNFPFRDPLSPELEDPRPVISESSLERAAAIQLRPCESVHSLGRIDSVLLERLSSHREGVILIGALNPPGGDDLFADTVVMIAEKLGWPVLCDVLNPLRHHVGGNRLLVTSYDAFLRDSETANRMRPTAFLQIGTLPTSKVLRAWLSTLDAVSFLCSLRPINTDPLHGVATPIYSDVHSLAEQIEDQSISNEWIESWADIEVRTRETLSTRLEAVDALFEGKVSALLSRHLPVGTPVFMASSMSVRYAEYFWAPGSRAYSIFCNRGANGIDGTLGTAMGVAHNAKPAVLLTGDLAFLHDANSMLASGELNGSLTIILINNCGGGIFEHLPIASMDPPFEKYFSTPQRVNVAKLCEAYGVEHQSVSDWDGLLEAIRQLPKAGLRVLELLTDRKADRETLRKTLAL
jgi:2-succinyl-5-enolpyruvyl-6-hydroxy-3-cyclohexene-1-carboxylate synthase